MNRPSAREVRRTAADLSDQVTPHLSQARDTLVDDVLPKVKATGVDLAIRAGLVAAPKKRHPFRMVAIVGALGVGAYAAWNAWRLPHGSDDWTPSTDAPDKVRTDDRTDASIPGVPADSTTVTF